MAEPEYNYGNVHIPRDVRGRFGGLAIPYIIWRTGPWYGHLSGEEALRRLEELDIRFRPENRAEIIRLYNLHHARGHATALLAMFNYRRPDGTVSFTAGLPSTWSWRGISAPTGENYNAVIRPGRPRFDSNIWNDNGTLNAETLARIDVSPSQPGSPPPTGAEVLRIWARSGITFHPDSTIFDGTDENYRRALAEVYDRTLFMVDGNGVRRIRPGVSHADAVHAMVTHHLSLSPDPNAVAEPPLSAIRPPPPETYYGITAAPHLFTGTPPNRVPDYRAIAALVDIPESGPGPMQAALFSLSRGRVIADNFRIAGITLAQTSDIAARYDAARGDGLNHEEAVTRVLQFQMMRDTLSRLPAHDTPFSLNRGQIPANLLLPNGSLNFQELAREPGSNLFTDPERLARMGIQMNREEWGHYLMSRMESERTGIAPPLAIERALATVGLRLGGSLNSETLNGLLSRPAIEILRRHLPGAPDAVVSGAADTQIVEAPTRIIRDGPVEPVVERPPIDTASVSGALRFLRGETAGLGGPERIAFDYRLRGWNANRRQLPRGQLDPLGRQVQDAIVDAVGMPRALEILRTSPRALEIVRRTGREITAGDLQDGRVGEFTRLLLQDATVLATLRRQYPQLAEAPRDTPTHLAAADHVNAASLQPQLGV